MFRRVLNKINRCTFLRYESYVKLLDCYKRLHNLLKNKLDLIKKKKTNETKLKKNSIHFEKKTNICDVLF